MHICVGALSHVYWCNAPTMPVSSEMYILLGITTRVHQRSSHFYALGHDTTIAFNRFRSSERGNSEIRGTECGGSARRVVYVNDSLSDEAKK